MKAKTISKKLNIRIIIIGFITFLLSLLVSYFVFVPLLTEKAMLNAEKTNNEIMSIIENSVTFVRSSTDNLAVAVSQNLEIEGFFNAPNEQNKNKAMISLSNLISREGLIRAVIIEPENNVLLESINKIRAEDYKIIESDWCAEIKKLPYSQGFSAVYPIEVSNAIYQTTAYVRSFHYNNKWNSYIVFATLNSVIDDVNAAATGNLDYLALIDAQGNIYHEMQSENWEQKDISPAIEAKNLNGKFDIIGGMLFKQTEISSNFSIVSGVSWKSVLASLVPYFTGIVIVLLSFLLLTMVATSRSLKSFTKPIALLSNNMKIAAKGNLECTVEIERNDEIGTLGESYNKMLGDLKRSLELIAEKEKQKEQTKFSLLVSQIDPHFIYNTINSINYLARKGRCEDIIIVNSALISILRDRLRVNDIQITDTIEHEIFVTKQYILIQQYMYDGDLEIIWEVEEKLLCYQIPKNLIQPLIENSLFHGLIDEESGEFSGKIEIKIWEREDCIKISVSDNGTGMDKGKIIQVHQQKFSEDERGKRIGISNIRERLFYLYGTRNCVEIESELGKGTRITLSVFCK